MKTTLKLLLTFLLIAATTLACKNQGDARGYEDNSLDAANSTAENATDTLELHGRTPAASNLDPTEPAEPENASTPNSTGAK